MPVAGTTGAPTWQHLRSETSVTRPLCACRRWDRSQSCHGVRSSAWPPSAAITHECRRRGWGLSGLLVDEGHSGRSLDRHALHEALRLIADGLIVAKLDRVSRSVVDFGRLLEWFDRVDGALVAIDLGMDTSTSSGRLVANVMASVAEWERAVIAERTRALAARKAQGLATGRPAVTGALAQHIAAQRAAGATYQTIAGTLNAERVPTLRGAAAWRVSSVQTAAGYKRRAPAMHVGDLPVPPRRAIRRPWPPATPALPSLAPQET